MTLTADLYDTRTRRFNHTYVPGGANIIGKFGYLAQTGVNSIYSDINRAPIPVVGGGLVEIIQNSQVLYTESTWSFSNNLYCIGFYDGSN